MCMYRRNAPYLKHRKPRMDFKAYKMQSSFQRYGRLGYIRHSFLSTHGSMHASHVRNGKFVYT